MMHLFEFVRRVSSMLILAASLLVALSSTRATALDLKKSLSYAESFNSLSGLLKPHETTQPAVYASDDSLMAVQGHSNKVSKALRFLHSKAGEAIYKRSNSMRHLPTIPEESPLEDGVALPQVSRSLGNLDGYVAQSPDMMGPPRPAAGAYEADGVYPPSIYPPQQQMDMRTDDEVISDACKDRPTMRCRFATMTALKQTPEVKARLALALRRKPDFVDGSKLLYHKLFESAIGKMEESGLDSKLDKGLGLVIDRSPYGFVANQAINMAMKKL